MGTTKRTPGYTKELWILPFDHRGSFQTKMFGIHGTPTAEQTAEIESYKMVVYEGFEKAVKNGGLPQDKLGILVDEQFGTPVLAAAKKKGVITCIPAEKSGQDEFDFEYGSAWKQHIEAAEPNFLKVLVRYNPEGDASMNKRQAERLATLSSYLLGTRTYFMFELLVPATDAQMERCKGDKNVFDNELRPQLMIRAIQELQKAGVEADVWKLEGLDRESDFESVCKAAKAGGREAVGCIVLGRGESDTKVKQWLSVGAHVPGVIGFAVGRTIFWEPLKALKEGKITRDEASKRVADKYLSLCDVWSTERA